jgi:hypothetical protein
MRQKLHIHLHSHIQTHTQTHTHKHSHTQTHTRIYKMYFRVKRRYFQLRNSIWTNAIKLLMKFTILTKLLFTVTLASIFSIDYFIRIRQSGAQ